MQFGYELLEWVFRYFLAVLLYLFLLRLGLGIVAGATQLVVDVPPADHLVPLLGARLVGVARAVQL